MKKGNELPTSTRLETLRREKGWTQEHLSKLVGCTPKTLRSWEFGTLPNSTDLISLSKIFGVSTDYILGLSDYKRSEYKMISELTLLNEKAVEALVPSVEDVDHDRVIDALNVLLPSLNFRNMLEDILEYFKKEKLLFQLHKNREKQIAKTLEEYKPNLPLLDLIESMTHKKEISELHAQRNFNYIFSELQRKAEE